MNKTTTTKKSIKSGNPKMNEEHGNADEFPFEPGNNVINALLNYSKSLSILKSRSGESFETVLN